MRVPPWPINDLEPPDCSSYTLNSINLTVPYCLHPGGLPVQYGFSLQQNNGAGWLDGYLERFFPRFVSLSSSFPLQVNDELKLSLRQSDYSVQLGLTGYKCHILCRRTYGLLILG